MTGSHAAGPGAAEPGPERAASGTAPTRVVLVGWPGADWKLLNRLVDEGQLPAVRQFMTGGCIGTLSGGRGPSREAIWTSMATGMRAFDHGVLGPMALDDGAAEAGISLPRHRRVPAVWEILESRGLRSHLVGWPVTHGSAPARGCIVSEAFGHPELARTDSLLSDAVTPASFRGELEEQWMLGEELDAAVLREFFQQWSGLDQLPASWLSAGAGALAYTFSRQAAFTWLLENEPWDFAAVCLPAIEWLDKRLLRGLNSSEDPAAVQRYLRVLAATYRLLDQMLERIRALAGPEAVVLLVSPYGFGSGSVHQRVNRRLEQELGGGSYRGALGIFAAAGPRFAADKLINGVSGVDIAPTLLHLFGLPVGKDMEGRVLGELYDEAPEVSSIASWRGSTTGREKSPHDDVPGAVLPDTILRTLYEQFIALGVVERAAPPKNANAALLDRSLRWTLAKSYIDGHRPISALPLLEDLSAEEPENANFMLQLANCQLKLGMTDEAHAMLTVILEDYPDSALAHLCMAYLENRRRRFDQALAHLDAAEQGGASPGMLHAHRGYALLQMRRWDEALQVFGRAETAAPQDAAG
ncbi:MAG: tetratricopeptide repeat protein, partial [Gammaproteobacteria bacterium]|nr:tetratricopeptide repeat protein [Gammaproteobacteria bacterium]